MKRLFFILAAVMMAASVWAEEQQVIYVQSTILLRSGNTYYYGQQEVMKKNQMLDWYARHNCQAAYNEFAKGLKLAKAGWACFGIGLALDLGSVVTAVAYVANNKGKNKSSDPAYLAAVGLGIGAFAFEVACIPTLAVGYSKMHRSVDIYNVGCSTAKTRPYWTLQASQNGIGLAYKF